MGAAAHLCLSLKADITFSDDVTFSDDICGEKAWLDVDIRPVWNPDAKVSRPGAIQHPWEDDRKPRWWLGYFRTWLRKRKISVLAENLDNLLDFAM